MLLCSHTFGRLSSQILGFTKVGRRSDDGCYRESPPRQVTGVDQKSMFRIFGQR
jgi:hypothetical protein